MRNTIALPLVCVLGLVCFLAASTLSATALAQEQRPPEDNDAQGIAERIGERIDRGVQRLGSELREGWSELRQSLDRLGVQGRVYSRLRWDKHVKIDSLDIEIEGRDTVILAGMAVDAEAKQKALQLAEDTVGVREVVDRIDVATPSPTE